MVCDAALSTHCDAACGHTQQYSIQQLDIGHCCKPTLQCNKMSVGLSCITLQTAQLSEVQAPQYQAAATSQGSDWCFVNWQLPSYQAAPPKPVHLVPCSHATGIRSHLTQCVVFTDHTGTADPKSSFII